MAATERDIHFPDPEDLANELKTWRRTGIAKLKNLDTPALTQAVRTLDRVEVNQRVGTYAIEALVRSASVRLPPEYCRAAQAILGLNNTTRMESPSNLRNDGASELHKSRDQFRQHYEPIIFSEIAHAIETEIHAYQLRLSKLRLDKRTPVGSRLAVEWLERFQTMYAIWTPISGLGGDLTAYRSTMLVGGSQWDRDPDPNDPEDIGYSQEIQAAGYIKFAFYHHTAALAAEQVFQQRYGGLWLLPDSQAETELADAMHRIRLESANNEQDDSYLRGLFEALAGNELDEFLRTAAKDEIAMDIYWTWWELAKTCQCDWEVGKRAGREHFPTHHANPRISTTCDIHRLVAACNDYCLLLDDAWDDMADWYHDLPRPKRINVTAEEDYATRSVDFGPIPGGP